MNCISDTEKFARRMFRICLVLGSRNGTDHSVLVDSLGPDLAVAGRFD